jgi:hypothetical protein
VRVRTRQVRQPGQNATPVAVLVLMPMVMVVLMPMVMLVLMAVIMTSTGAVAGFHNAQHA